MAPSRRKTTPSTNPTRRIMTRSIYKKQQQTLLSSPEAVSSAIRSPSSQSNECSYEIGNSTTCHDICSTPKGDKYMIPKIATCPPAPKKKRLVLNCLPIRGSSASASSTAKFLAHSDLELFFLFAPRNIHA